MFYCYLFALVLVDEYFNKELPLNVSKVLYFY